MRKRKFLLLFFAGLVITAGVLYWAGAEDVLSQFLKLDARYFLLFFGIQIALMVLWALKWWVILRQHKVSFRKLLPVSFFGSLMNNLTPMSTAGGEPFRAYLLAQVDDISTEDSAASVVVDLFLEVFPLILMIGAAMLITITYDIHYLLAAVLGIAGLAVFLILGFILLIIINEKVSEMIIHQTLRLFRIIPIKFLQDHATDAQTRIDKIIHNFQKTMHTSVTDKKTMLTGLTIASLIWVLNILRMYYILHMLGYTLPITTLIVIRVGVVALTFVSIFPGGLGLWEGGSTWLYTIFDLPAPTALAATLIERLFSFWIGSTIGLAATIYIGATHMLKKYFQ